MRRTRPTVRRCHRPLVERYHFWRAAYLRCMRRALSGCVPISEIPGDVRISFTPISIGSPRLARAYSRMGMLYCHMRRSDA